ncbi:hypothetical protein HGRIS_001662 [Hohenbuehelia grisea]|uniref:F-box domain-containing protein n=1 Tax=Hohenbuehelia grisea TaxID=104357 RepID=A0ABR3JI27_9AGAR
MASKCTVDETIRSIDREIEDERKRHEQAMRTLKGRRNNCAPISKLPDELLLRIFELVNWNCLLKSPAAFSFTQVSSKWRCLALADTRLWRRIELYPGWPAISRFILTMATRANHRKLDIVYADSGYQANHFSIQLLRSVMESILMHPGVEFASLDIQAHCYGDLERYTRLLAASTGLATLQKMSIGHRSRTPAGYTLPLALAESEAPRLQSFSLDRCAVPWGSPFLQSFTHSLTSFSLVNPPQPVALINLLSQLRNMPCLRHLVLNDCLAPLASGDSLAAEKATLRDLEYFEFHSYHISNASFIKFVGLPSHTSVSCSLDYSKEDFGGASADLNPRESRNTHDLSLQKLEALSWYLAVDPSSKPLAFDIVHSSRKVLFNLDNTCPRHEADGRRQLYVHGLQADENLIAIPSVLLGYNALPCNQIIRLSFNHQLREPRDTWTPAKSLAWWSALITLGNVKELQTNDPYMASSILRLSSNTELYFPHLTKLDIREVDYTDAQGVGLCEELHAWLVLRADSLGYSKRVEVTNGRVRKEQLDMLSSVIGTIHVAGKGC